jgi:hypothetical protein
LIENSTDPLKISNQRNKKQKNSKINQFHEKCQRCGKIWEEFKWSERVYFHQREIGNYLSCWYYNQTREEKYIRN